MTVTVPCGRWTRPGPVARYACCSAAAAAARGRVGELVDDDEALGRVLGQLDLVTRRAARRRAAAPRPAGPRPGCRRGRGSCRRGRGRARRGSARPPASPSSPARPMRSASTSDRDRGGRAAADDEDAAPRSRRRARTPLAVRTRRHPGGQSNARPAHQVDVEVVDRLAAPAADVRDEPVPGVGDPVGPREVGGHGEQPPEHRTVGLGQLGGRRDVAARHEQDVGRGPRARCRGWR